MTKITFFKENGNYTGLVADGHAGYADEGQDIICAAISVLITTTINALDEINHEEIDLGMNESEGYLMFKILTRKDPSSQVLMKALVLGLESIQNEYGSKYCLVDYKEETQNVKA